MIKNKIQREIFDILGKYDYWENDMGDEQNNEAKQALIEVLALCRKIHPDKYYSAKGMGGHLGYLQQLFKVRRALLDSYYMRACNELRNLVYLYPFTQARILNNVIALLADYLEDGD